MAERERREEAPIYRESPQERHYEDRPRDPPTRTAPPARYDEHDERPRRYERQEGRGDERRPYSIGATFLGWCVASFLSLVFLALIFVGLGGAAAAADGLTQQEIAQFGIAGVVGSLLAFFLAYLVGGYAAGRIGLWNGVGHGAGVPVWAIVLTLLVALVGAVGIDFTAIMAEVNGVATGDLTGPAVIMTLVTLVVMFGGAMLGGMLGERTTERRTARVGGRATTRRGAY